MIDSVSTPGAPRGPSTSVITPSPSWNVRGEADHLEDDLVVGLGVLGAGIADQNRLREERAVDLHVGGAGRFEIRADELVRLALDDLDDLAFGIGAADVAVLVFSRTSTVSPWRRPGVDRRR